MITKAIIPLAGLATRHLPLSKVVSKEFLPLVDKPLVHYAVQEVKDAGAREIIFVVSAQKKVAADYFKKVPQLEKILSERSPEGREEKKQEDLLSSLAEAEKLAAGLTFSYVLDKP